MRRLLPAALYRLGRTHVELKDWAAAVVALDRLLADFPDNPYRREAQYLRAESLLRNGDPSAAEKGFAALLAEPPATTDPKGMIPGVRLKRIQCWVALKRWKEALEGAQAEKGALAPGDPTLAELDYVTGQALLGLGQLEKARAAFQAVIDVRKVGDLAAQAQLMRGETYFHQDQFHEALRDFLKVDILHESPRWQAAALLEAGKVYERLDQWADAAETYERLLSKFPTEPSAAEARQRRDAASRRSSSSPETGRKGLRLRAISFFRRLSSEFRALSWSQIFESLGRIPFMRRCKSTDRAFADFATRGLLVVLAVGCAVGADFPHQINRADLQLRDHGHAQPAFGQRVASQTKDGLHIAIDQVRRLGRRLAAWYIHTPPADRVTWGGMTACAGLGLGVLLERLARLRRHRIVPLEFTVRFLDRLHEGRLDCGEALDHCERNPSPAARVALAAVRRWGRPAADLERAVTMAHRVESERLRRNVGTLRRIAVLTPLLGLLGTLFALGRALEGVATVAPPGLNLTTSAPVAANLTVSSIAWGPLLAAALTPLSAGLILATLALVAYDGLLTRIEKLTGSLDRLGAETIDAIALAAPVSSPAIALAPVSPAARTPHQSRQRQAHRGESIGHSSEQDTGS